MSSYTLQPDYEFRRPDFDAGEVDGAPDIPGWIKEAKAQFEDLSMANQARTEALGGRVLSQAETSRSYEPIGRGVDTRRAEITGGEAVRRFSNTRAFDYNEFAAAERQRSAEQIRQIEEAKRALVLGEAIGIARKMELEGYLFTN